MKIMGGASDGVYIEHRLFFGNVYLNAPTGNIRLSNREIIRTICQIGKEQYPGIKGSSLARGVRFLSQKFEITKTAIKNMYRATKNAFVCIISGDDSFVFRFHKEKFFLVYEYIASEFIKKLSKGNGCENISEVLLENSMQPLRDTKNNASSVQIHKCSLKLLNDIESIDKRYCQCKQGT